ncbi:MAG: sulfatase [Bacteroidales bacterium]|nr:sulfatase [Bacteroidales bacterium]
MKIAPLFRKGALPVLVVMALLAAGCKQEQTQKPNILFAIADDWGWPHAGIYGDPVVQTPVFDRIAREGVLFNHAYISSPSCTPSRNAILTGQYHWRLGPGANLWSTLDPSTPVYPLLLEDAGYKTGRFRKSWGPGDISNWERHPAGHDYTESGFAAFMAERTGDQPFCFFLGTSDPHRPYDQGTGVQSGMELEKIRLFECLPDHEVVRSDVADYYYEVQRFDTLVANALKILEEYGELENTIIVMTGDHGMPFPRCKSNNYDSGARIPFAVRWGSKIKKPGRVLDDFISTTDLGPTFLELAGVDIPAVMTGQSFAALLAGEEDGFVDRENRSYVLHGKERHVPGQEEDLGGYPVRAIRTHDYLYIRNFREERWPSGTPNYLEAAIPYCWLGDCDNGPTKSYMVEYREKDQQHQELYDLAFGKRPSEELYDCRKDPEQLVNVADNPAYLEIREKLSGLLLEQLKATGDPRATGGGEEFDQVPYLGQGPRHPSYKPEP